MITLKNDNIKISLNNIVLEQWVLQFRAPLNTGL